MRGGKTFDWLSFWDTKAKARTDFQATGRGRMDIIGFLYTIREIAYLLQLQKNDIVLDIGCGTGIISLALSPWVEKIHGIDISLKMIKRAAKNCAGISKIAFSVGSITNLGVHNRVFNKIFAYSVLQYLKREEDVFQVFKEMSRILDPGGIVLLAANPDPASREKYIKVSVTTEMSLEERNREMEIIESTLWISPETMIHLAAEAGLRAKARPICQSIWQHFYMFDLVITNKL